MEPAEIEVINTLAAAWNRFLSIPSSCDADDLNDFRKAIHDAQRIVAYASAARASSGLLRIPHPQSNGESNA
jgi:hypothetical protein